VNTSLFRRFRALLLCGSVPIAIAALLALIQPAAFARLDRAVYDTMLRWSPTASPDPRVVIVDIDERSLAAIGQWPWRRDNIARLITRLRDLGAATIALDIIFAEPDRDQDVVRVNETWSAGGVGTPDDLLAQSLRPGKVVLGYAMTFEPGAPSAARCLLHPLNVAIVDAVHSAAPLKDDESPAAPVFRATGSACNLRPLAEAAGRSGFLNAAPDADGVLRRAPVLMELDGSLYPSLGVAAVSAAGSRDAVLRIATANSTSLTFDGREVPLDGKGNLLLRYRGQKRTFPYLSAADVIDGRITPGALTNKIVFVGTTALGTREVVATPLDTLFVGVEVQATIADNLLRQDFIVRPASAPIREGLTALVCGALLMFVAVRGRAQWSAAAALACLAVLWIGAVVALSAGVLFSPLYPTLALVFGLTGTTIAGVVLERKRADTAMLEVSSAVHRAETAGRETSKAQRLMIETLLSLTETRDVDTGKHSRRTSRYARLLAGALAKNPAFATYLTTERIELLSSLAPLHDIGKVGVPDAVLNKPGALTPEEMVEMQRHPVYGRDVICRAEKESGIVDDVILGMAKEIVYTHHEKWDGSGYPEGLKGAGIPVPGRVMAVIDVYDACTARRVYSEAMSHDDAIAHIVKRKGSHFDPDVVDAFLTVAEDISLVRLEQ
jgi:adenylate cyclase